MDTVPDFKQMIRTLVSNGVPLDITPETDRLTLKIVLADAGIPRNIVSNLLRVYDAANVLGVDWEFLEEYDRDAMQATLHAVTMLKMESVGFALDLLFECVAPPAADLDPSLRFAIIDGMMNVFGTDEEQIRIEVPEQVRMDGGLHDVCAVGARAFWGSTVLSDIVLPGTITSIGRNAFWGCTSLMFLELPDSIEEIGPDAFSRCSSLTRIVLPKGLLRISKGAFSSCIGLKRIEIPEGVTTIGDDAFRYCTSLESVSIPDTVTEFGENVFDGCPFLDDATKARIEELTSE